MTRILLVVALCALLLLTACGVFTPEQAAGIEATLRQAATDGAITQAQLEAALEALHSQTSPDWTTLSAIAANIGLTLAGVPAYVSWSQKRQATATAKP